MNNFEAENLLTALNRISTSDLAIPTLPAYWILVNRDKLENAIRAYINMKDKIILKYDKNGKVTNQTPGFDKCVAEINAIGTEEADVPDFKKVPLTDLKDDKIPINLLNAIMPIIEAPEEKDGK